MLYSYKEQSSEWLLDEIIKEANEVEFPSESNLLFELRSELLSRLTQRVPDVEVCACKNVPEPHRGTWLICGVCLKPRRG